MVEQWILAKQRVSFYRKLNSCSSRILSRLGKVGMKYHSIATLGQGGSLGSRVGQLNQVQAPSTTSLREHPIFSASVSPAEKNLFFGGREATTGNTSAVLRIQHHMPTPKFLKLYPTQKKRAYATGIVLYNRNIFLELQYLAPDQGNGCLHLLTYFSISQKDCAFTQIS